MYIYDQMLPPFKSETKFEHLSNVFLENGSILLKRFHENLTGKLRSTLLQLNTLTYIKSIHRAIGSYELLNKANGDVSNLSYIV